VTVSRRLIVVKYGGSVLEGGSAIRGAAEAIKRALAEDTHVVVVVSALKGVTDGLLSTAEEISPDIRPDVIDRIIGLGEEQSVRLMTAALRSIGVAAVEVTPDSPSWPIVTDETFGNAEPILEECRRQAELGLKPLIERGEVPVVCGFVGMSPSGKMTTLGRGGGDVTAAILARCLDADELVLVKDVGGIYSADPHKIEDARPIEALEAREARLLASTGARVLHGKVFDHLPGDLRVRITSSRGALDEGGTVISGVAPHLEVETHGRPLLRVTIVGDVISNPETLTRVYRRIEDDGGRVLSLTGEDHATTLYVDGDSMKTLRGVHSLVEETDGVKAVSVSENLALTAVEGIGPGNTAGLAQKVIGTLSLRGIEIHDMFVGRSSMRIMVEWEKMEEASRSIGEVLEEV